MSAHKRVRRSGKTRGARFARQRNSPRGDPCSLRVEIKNEENFIPNNCCYTACLCRFFPSAHSWKGQND